MNIIAWIKLLPSGHPAAVYAPVFDGDGCEPGAAKSGGGSKNLGLTTKGVPSVMCHDDFSEISNTTHRYACVKEGGVDYYVDFYALYFQKDQCGSGALVTNIVLTCLGNIACGHAHDREYVGVWATDGGITHVCASAHGECHPEAVSSLPFQGGYVMVVYHQTREGAVGATHAVRFAKNVTEPPQNDEGQWIAPALVSWYELTGLVEVQGDGIGNDDGICNDTLVDQNPNPFEACEAGLGNKEMRCLLNTHN